MLVCIAGMHRSGTSMVAKMLHESGLYLGPASDLIPSDPAKGEGHWENKRFVRINRAILTKLGGAWDCPPPIPADWTGDCLAPYRAEAEALLADFAGRGPSGWKDPRNCLTLPFWQAILGPVRVIVIVRNPLEVAASLRQRNGFSYALGLTLWQTYNRRLLDAVAPSERIVTHYDAHFDDPAGELRRLLPFAGLPVAEAIVDKARAAQEADRRHHRLTTRDLRNADVAPAILNLYRDLCAEANWSDKGYGTAHRAAELSLLDDDLARSPDDPDSSERPTAADRRPLRRGVGRLRQQLEEATARIAELEQVVEAQRLALSGKERSGAS